jgi:aryl-alcohol dehydrogenase-like predicted oxidoreductase
MQLTESSPYGDSEELIGKWFKRTGKRNDIFIATKFGFLKGTGFRGFDSSAAYCKQACEKSLELLGIDYIDLCELSFKEFDSALF